MDINEKIDKIKYNENCNSRCINTILNNIKYDKTLTDNQLSLLVEKSYQTGKHRKPSYIKRHFKVTMKWLKKELSKST